MKTIKTVLIVMLSLSLSLLFAGKPQKPNKNDELVSLLIQKLEKDIVLTDSQKVQITQKLKIYILKSENADTLRNPQESVILKQKVFDEYQNSLDSILTSEQRIQIKMKIQARERGE